MSVHIRPLESSEASGAEGTQARKEAGDVQDITDRHLPRSLKLKAGKGF